MSQRLGMADGRCFTINTSSQLFNNYMMDKNGISFEDNYSYRQLLQKQGPEILSDIQDNTPCHTSNKPLLKVPNIY
uniref:Uncharacterized protein n=1 Tax=Mantoniella tinhauana virus 1 TaxID=3111543 RepID=A0AB38ZM30_9VIRU